MKNFNLFFAAVAAISLASCGEKAVPDIPEDPLAREIVYSVEMSGRTSMWAVDDLFNYMVECTVGLNLPEGYSAECGFRMDSDEYVADKSGASCIFPSFRIDGPFQGDFSFSTEMRLGRDSDGMISLDPSFDQICVTPMVTIFNDKGKSLETVFGEPYWAEPATFMVIYPMQ